MQIQSIVFNDFRAQWEHLREKILVAINRVGASGQLILGKEISRFEQMLATYWCLDYAVGCGNGMDAIEIGLRALNLPQGAKVLTTPLSAFATSLAIVRAGGRPVFVDTDNTGLIDLHLCEKILSENPEIRYFVPVHLYGHALSHSNLIHLKNTFELYILEDCAQAIGAKNEDHPAGSVGDIVTTSFYPTKNLGCMGDGGALLTSNKDLYLKALSLRNYGQSQKYIHTTAGLNSRLDEIQAAILQDAFLPALPSLTQKRQNIAKKYRAQIRHRNIFLPPIPNCSDSVWHLFPILIKNNLEDFQNYLKNRGIHTERHYPFLIPQQKALTQFSQLTELTVSQQFASAEVSLPIHPYLTEEQTQYVIDVCNNWK